MNRIYEVIWNKSKNSCSVVSEMAKNRGKTSGCRNKAVLAAMILSLLSAGGLAYAEDPATPPAAPDKKIPYFSVNANNSAKPAGTNWESDGAKGAASIAVGPSAGAQGDFSTAVGPWAKADGKYANAFGVMTNATGKYATAVGPYAKAVGDYTLAAGKGAKSTAKGAAAFGASAEASSGWATAVGYQSKAEGNFALAAGVNANATGGAATVVGAYAKAAGKTSSAFGYLAQAKNNESVAIGAYAEAEKHAAAIGPQAKALDEQSVAVGWQAEAQAAGSLALGSQASATQNGGVALGGGSLADRQAGAWGFDASAGNAMDEDTLLGEKKAEYEQAIDKLTGLERELQQLQTQFNESRANDPVDANGKPIPSDETKQIQENLKNKEDEFNAQSKLVNGYVNAWQSIDGAVSVGNADLGVTRQITGVAAGTEDTDAVNVAQIKAITKQMEEQATHYFSVNANDSKKPAGTNWNNDGAKGAAAIAVGKNAVAQGKHGAAVGSSAQAGGDQSSAFGVAANASGRDAIAAGSNTVAGAANASAFGAAANATGKSATAVGAFADASGELSLAAGDKAKASEIGASAFGTKAEASANRATALGYMAKAEGVYSLAAGYGSSATGEAAYAFGVDSKADGGDAIAIGSASEAQKDGGIAIGSTAIATQEFGVALGAGSIADRDAGVSGYLAGDATSEAWQATVAAVAVGNEKEGFTRQITGVAAGTEDTDAVNVVQLKKLASNVNEQMTGLDTRITTNTENITVLNGRVDQLDTRVGRIGAGAAALAGLHPLDYDPENKWDFAAGYGNYSGANAVAIGAFYRPNENQMFSIGGSFGGGENMVNAGISVKFGEGTGISTSKVAMANEIKNLKIANEKVQQANKAMQQENKAMQQENKEMKNEIEILKQQVQQLMARK